MHCDKNQQLFKKKQKKKLSSLWQVKELLAPEQLWPNCLRFWGYSIFSKSCITKIKNQGWDPMNQHFHLYNSHEFLSCHQVLFKSSIWTAMTHKANKKHGRELVSLLEKHFLASGLQVVKSFFVNKCENGGSTSPIRQHQQGAARDWSWQEKLITMFTKA